jgi:CheY-like chemotaxis protein
MIILVADDNALSRELIRELLEGSGQAAEKFWIPADLLVSHHTH